MIRKLILGGTAVYFIALGSLVLLLYQASPGPEGQEIYGAAIGQWNTEEGIVFLSGRRLDCEDTAVGDPYAAICTAEIAGKPLQIKAVRNIQSSPFPFGGRCQAFYDGQTWPCDFGSRHIQVHWFAYIQSDIGLDKAEMAQLRRQYFIENLPEEIFLWGMVVAAVLTALVIITALTAWFWPKAKTQKIRWAVGMGLLSIPIFFGALILGVKITSSFWD
jgi:hypothetical protein